MSLQDILDDNSIIFKTKNHKLRNRQIERLRYFAKTFDGSHKAILVFRGDSDENLLKQFNASTVYPKSLEEMIFMFGNKSRNCWDKKRKRTVDSENLSDDNFSHIMSMVSRLLRAQDLTERQTISMERFKIQNPGFESRINEGGLIERYHKLEKEYKHIVLDYYLAFLHTIVTDFYSTQSPYVSSTTNLSKAYTYSTDILFYGWVPISRVCDNGMTIRYEDINRKKVEVERLGFPAYKTSLFQSDNEICLKCGLLPHFIIGFKIEDVFHVNPFVTNNRIENIEDIVNNGFPIDQTSFIEELKRTNYNRYYTFDNISYRFFDI